MSELPREVVELAIDRRVVLVAPQAPEMSAYRLTQIATGHAEAHWQPLRWLVPTKDVWLRDAWLRYDYANGAPPLAVGCVRRLDARAPAFYVVLEGEPLRDRGRVLLFAERRRAQRAAELAAVVLSAQRLSHSFVEMVRRADTLTESDLPPFDAEMRSYRGALWVAAPDWAGRTVGITIPENLGPKGRGIIAQLLSVGLNRPAATGAA
jgi:acetyl esterase/lipase